MGQRIAQQLQVGAGSSRLRGPKVLALTSSPARVAQLQAQGITPLQGNLDDAKSLHRLRGVARYVVHLAPPPAVGRRDTRTQHLLRVLGQGSATRRLVYGSTTGVYGDCAGAWVDETRPVQPMTERAQRRADAEQQVRRWGVRRRVGVQVLRIPGIYAPDREGGTPRTRLLKGLPVLHANEDVFTNHIHADDLAQIALAALWRGHAMRTYNACDSTQMRMGEYLDWAADGYGLPRPPRVSRAQAQQLLSPMMLSFMGESRRLRNARMLRELRVRLRYPTVREGLGL